MEQSTSKATLQDDIKYLNDTQTDRKRLAETAVDKAMRQISACYEFKKPRLAKLAKYWRLYDGDTPKKLRQLFNVPIPVFPGMIDTLNAQYDTPITLKFREGDASDYFKVQKVQGAFDMEVMNTNNTSKWDSKLRMARKHAIMNGRAIVEYRATSDPEYKSEITNINLKDFNFQPRGGLYLENHLFAGVENIQKTRADLTEGALSGIYEKEQVSKLVMSGSQSDYLPGSDRTMSEKLSRFKPLGLDPDNNSYVGDTVYKLVNHVLLINGQRYYICFDPWTKIWVRFEKWKDVDSSNLYPWKTYATHEDDENFLSKSYGDDLYAAADAIVAMFNQELTNREKKNFGARAYDKDMFPDVRKLDEAMHRPDALVPADTKGGTRQIAQGIYQFQVGELNGTVNLIDWITGSLGRNTGATDLAQGSTQEVSKKASVTFAEQKSVSKRIGWGAQPFQDMMSDLGRSYIWGLKDHMPAKFAIRIMGEIGWDWDEITRMDLDTTKDIDILIVATDQQIKDSEIKAEKRAKALGMVDPNFVNPQKRNEEILRSVGEYEDAEIAEFLDVKTYSDRKAIAKASECIQQILMGQSPLQWYGANIAFIQKIVDFAGDKRSTLGPKYKTLITFAMSHTEIARDNIQRQVQEQAIIASQQQMRAGGAPGGTPVAQPQDQSKTVNPGIPGGISKAMSVAAV